MWTAQRIEYEGNDVQLFCRASDRRDVKITWFDRNGDEITVNDSQYKVSVDTWRASVIGLLKCHQKVTTARGISVI